MEPLESHSLLTVPTTRWWGCRTKIEDKTCLSSRLDVLYDAADGEPRTFLTADPMTIRIRGVMVVKNFDWGVRAVDSNDLMIVSVTSFGSEPPIERVHFIQNDTPLGWHGDFFNDVILAVPAYPGEKRQLTLRIQVYDIDRPPVDLISEVRKASSSVAVSFPSLAVYAASVSFATDAFVKLVEGIDRHDRIIDERITFAVAEPESGHRLLQPGYYVCFADPVPAVEKQYYLSNQLHVVDERNQGFTNTSYAVIGVERDFREPRQWEIDQKVSKLVNELNGKGQSGRGGLSFLRETLQGYDKFRRLERAYELVEQAETGELTEPEQRLLEKLWEDRELKHYLPPKSE